jgi:hypothetical protein
MTNQKSNYMLKSISKKITMLVAAVLAAFAAQAQDFSFAYMTDVHISEQH